MVAHITAMSVASAETWALHNKAGQEYVIQIGYPLNWSSSAPAGDTDVPIL